jgi:hypothetical protein
MTFLLINYFALVKLIASSCPRDLDPDVKAKLDTSFGGSGYMTTELFTTWLLAFDAAMDGRQIALLMDNAPGHGKEGGLEQQLRNIRLIRLPKNTTSVSQPLDAGIIMSFKVKYSRLMIPVMSYYYHERKLHDEREKLKEPGERKRFNFLTFPGLRYGHVSPMHGIKFPFQPSETAMPRFQSFTKP